MTTIEILNLDLMMLDVDIELAYGYGELEHYAQLRKIRSKMLDEMYKYRKGLEYDKVSLTSSTAY